MSRRTPAAVPATPVPVRKTRCAVYTRKSTDEGLEKEFNSLDAQRESCEAYIASQRAEGWLLVPDRYDDGGVSGGTLASTFMLSTKPGKEAYVAPVIEAGGYRFTVKVGKPQNSDAAKLGTTAGKRAAFRCLMSDVAVSYDHIRQQGKAGHMGAKLMAIVAEGDRGRVYLSPTEEHEQLARDAKPDWKPDMLLPDNPRDFKTPNYGLTTFGDLFTQRQLVALNCFSDLVLEAREAAKADALAAGRPSDPTPLANGGTGAQAYADALAVYISFAISKLADRGSTICTWFTERDSTRNTFARQSIPMTWDHAELNTLLDGTGSFLGAIEWTAESIDGVASSLGSAFGISKQLNASNQNLSESKIISTDPPYYDNIGYADLSDFFYVWLRRTLKSILPDLFGTLAVPKSEELVATPYRHGGKEAAEAFFLGGMTEAVHRLAEHAHPGFPTTIYYAFKQSETDLKDGTASTGWETFLDAVVRAGFGISGTWPMRTELGNRMVGSGNNALASSIVLVCRPRSISAPTATRVNRRRGVTPTQAVRSKAWRADRHQDPTPNNSGAESCVDFADFARDREALFRDFLALPGGLPSHDTFSRLFRLLDPAALSSCLDDRSSSVPSPG